MNGKAHMDTYLQNLATEWGCTVAELADDPHSVWGEMVEAGMAADDEGGFAYVAGLVGAEGSY